MMHRLIFVFLLVILVMILSAILSPPEAAEKDLYCYLEATTDVKLEVWEQDKRGNKLQRIWKGNVQQGKRQRINTRFGRIRYASSVVMDKNAPLSGDKHRWCEDGGTIGVP